MNSDRHRSEEYICGTMDLREQNFSIEGLAVGVIRNGEWL